MTQRIFQADEKLPTEATEVLMRLFKVVEKCTKWGDHGERKLGLKSSKIRGGTMYLRLSATNTYLAANYADLHLYIANYDLKEIEGGLKEIDLDEIEAIISQLEELVKNVSPVDL